MINQDTEYRDYTVNQQKIGGKLVFTVRLPIEKLLPSQLGWSKGDKIRVDLMEGEELRIRRLRSPVEQSHYAALHSIKREESLRAEDL